VNDTTEVGGAPSSPLPPDGRRKPSNWESDGSRVLVSESWLQESERSISPVSPKAEPQGSCRSERVARRGEFSLGQEGSSHGERRGYEANSARTVKGTRRRSHSDENPRLDPMKTFWVPMLNALKQGFYATDPGLTERRAGFRKRLFTAAKARGLDLVP